MGAITYDMEISSSIPPARMYKAFVLDANTIVSKVLPPAITSVQTLEGDGGPGTIKLTTFGEVMLPEDVTDLEDESSDAIRDLMVMQQSLQRVAAISDSMKVAKLYPRIFMEGWLACLTELSILEDNPAWSKTTPIVELPESPKPTCP
ncbi:hypothetical protein Acr_22g0008510 [Actinidia rufa]|uniref:Bet v I/Major latex protein domain-containing protein n=1 Tax=Actinidia rufa TaxID=165716 RepID=A0A7J0GKX3_9ERIC|nr:hypothetical protein Acr_22g0008510 [Actinidia rufa]